MTLPIIGAGIASVKAATTFENAFTRIRAISNASAKSIQSWRGEVLELAAATGRAPNELAEALFFLASAGLKAGQEMEVLRATARASTVGLGDMSAIAMLTANVLNAYADSGLTAARAMDILVAAVREGTAEPDEFAAAMGRILPIASKAKVGFEQVAAALAGLSNIGLGVNEGVTAMRSLLNALVAPTSMTAKTLDKLGISANRLRSIIGEQGILAALEMLMDRTGGNIDTLRKLIPNIRALTGALGVTGENAEAVAGIFERVAGSKGSLDKAFEEAKTDPLVRFQQALAQLKVTGIEVGRDLIPVATQLLQTFGRWAKALRDLDPATRSFVIESLAMAAAIGPLARLLGGVLTIAGKLTGTITRLGTATSTVAAGAGTATGSVGGLRTAAVGLGRLLLRGAAMAGVFAFGKALWDMRSAASALSGALDEVRDSVGELAREARLGFPAEEYKAATNALDQAENVIASIRQEMADLSFTNPFDLIRMSTEAWAHLLPGIESTYERLEREALEWERRSLDAADTFREALEALVGLRDAASGKQLDILPRQVEGQLRFFTDNLKRIEGLAPEVQGQIAGLVGAYARLGGNVKRLNLEFILNLLQSGNVERAMGLLKGQLERVSGAFQKSLRGVFRSVRAYKEWGRALANAHGLTRRQRHNLADLMGAMQRHNVTLTDSQKEYFKAAIETGNYQEAVAILRNRLKEIPKKVRSRVVAETAQAQAAIDAFIHNNKGRVIGVTVQATGLSAVGGGHQIAAGGIRMGLGGVLAAQHGLVARSPTVLVGEGRYATPFGQGTEGVLPFDSRGQRILGEAVVYGLRRVGFGEAEKVDERALTRAFRDALQGMAVVMDGHRVGWLLEKRELERRA